MPQENTPDMPQQVSWQKQAVKQVFGLLLAGVFLYFSFRGTNFNKVMQYASELDLGYLVLIFFVSVFSHVLRAWRWVILLSPLSQNKISLWNSFCAVMYGYAVNIVIPRGGEIVRLVSISKMENIPWAGVLPTMFIDRLLDIAMLVLLLGLTIVVFPFDQLNMPNLLPAGILMCVMVVVGLLALPFVGKIIRALSALPSAAKIITDLSAMPLIGKAIPPNVMSKVEELSYQFDEGTSSLSKPLNWLKIAVSSFAIWALYWSNTYLMIWAFHLDSKIDLVKSLVIFTIGSIGVLVPTPGSAGSYHLLVSQALQKIVGMNADHAGAFAIVLHLLCFIITTCIPAAICFVIQTASNKRNAAVGGVDSVKS